MSTLEKQPSGLLPRPIPSLKVSLDSSSTNHTNMGDKEMLTSTSSQATRLSPFKKPRPSPETSFGTTLLGNSSIATRPSHATRPFSCGAQYQHSSPAETQTTALPDSALTCSAPCSLQANEIQSAGGTPSLRTPHAFPLRRLSTIWRGAFVKVVDYGVTAEQGARRTMEDQHVMLAGGIPFFGVYDGHGGTQCAEYLRDHLHKLVLDHPDIKSDPERAITESIVKADSDFLKRPEDESNDSGSVCAVAIIIDDTLVIGNVGDCEAVLCRGGSPVVLTVKHNLVSNLKEATRVREAGGKIFHNRVGHPRFNPSVVSLAVTRAIGDAGFKLDEYTDGKPSGIIAIPNTSSIQLTNEDEFLIIGCDGLWDVMSYAEVIDFCAQSLKSGEMAQSTTDKLAHTALNKGGTDNVTAMLVHLQRRRDSQSADYFTQTAAFTSVRNTNDET